MDDRTPDLTAGPNAGALRTTAAALRDCERQVANARHHVQARVADLEQTERQSLADCSLLQQAGDLSTALEQLRRALVAQHRSWELRRVLDLL